MSIEPDRIIKYTTLIDYPSSPKQLHFKVFGERVSWQIVPDGEMGITANLEADPMGVEGFIERYASRKRFTNRVIEICAELV